MMVYGTLIKEIEHGSYGVTITAKWALLYRAYQFRDSVEDVGFDEPLLQSLTLSCGGIDRDLALPEGFALGKWIDAFHLAADAVECREEAAQECRDNYYNHHHHKQGRQK